MITNYDYTYFETKHEIIPANIILPYNSNIKNDFVGKDKRVMFRIESSTKSKR